VVIGHIDLLGVVRVVNPESAHLKQQGKEEGMRVLVLGHTRAHVHDHAVTHTAPGVQDLAAEDTNLRVRLVMGRGPGAREKNVAGPDRPDLALITKIVFHTKIQLTWLNELIDLYIKRTTSCSSNIVRLARLGNT